QRFVRPASEKLSFDLVNDFSLNETPVNDKNSRIRVDTYICLVFGSKQLEIFKEQVENGTTPQVLVVDGVVGEIAQIGQDLFLCDQIVCIRRVLLAQLLNVLGTAHVAFACA